MATVTVWKIKFYNMRTDNFTVSRRMATQEGAKRMHGEIIVGTEVEIDESELESGFEWTPIDFRPVNERHGGFQTQVTR